MALMKCHECRKEVSDQAKLCPHCGAKVKKPSLVTAIAGVAALVAVACVLEPMVPQTPTTAPKVMTQVDYCKADWHRCLDNEQLANHWQGWMMVQTKCQKAATESAPYGTPEWTSWLSTFSTYLTGNDYIASGIAVAIEKNAQFQNTFGAKVHSRVTCTYDLRNSQVLKVEVTPLE